MATLEGCEARTGGGTSKEKRVTHIPVLPAAVVLIQHILKAVVRKDSYAVYPL